MTATTGKGEPGTLGAPSPELSAINSPKKGQEHLPLHVGEPTDREVKCDTEVSQLADTKATSRPQSQAPAVGPESRSTATFSENPHALQARRGRQGCQGGELRWNLGIGVEKEGVSHLGTGLEAMPQRETCSECGQEERTPAHATLSEPLAAPASSRC